MSSTEYPKHLNDYRYLLVSQLGEGGMAAVFRGYDQRLKAWRAIKIMAPHLATKAKLRKRFEGEAQMMALLEHRNIVRVYDVGVDGASSYIVMELLEGGCLVDWLEDNGAMPPRMAVKAVMQTADGLHAAHKKGVIHRDIKPHNVLITTDGEMRVTDFGIARINDGNMSMTKTGAVMGTWGYMAPEQRSDAKHVDARADEYALGATLYSLLTNKTPMDLFAADRDASMMAGIEPQLVDVLIKCTEYRREDRFDDVIAFKDALGEILDSLPEDPPGTPPVARPSGDPPTIPDQADFEEDLMESPTSGGNETMAWMGGDEINVDQMFPEKQPTGEVPQQQPQAVAAPPGTVPGYPPGTAPGYPPGTVPGYPPGTAPGYPPGTVPGYPPGTAPGYPPGTAPGYPPGVPQPGAGGPGQLTMGPGQYPQGVPGQPTMTGQGTLAGQGTFTSGQHLGAPTMVGPGGYPIPQTGEFSQPPVTSSGGSAQTVAMVGLTGGLVFFGVAMLVVAGIGTAFVMASPKAPETPPAVAVEAPVDPPPPDPGKNPNDGSVDAQPKPVEPVEVKPPPKEIKKKDPPKEVVPPPPVEVVPPPEEVAIVPASAPMAVKAPSSAVGGAFQVKMGDSSTDAIVILHWREPGKSWKTVQMPYRIGAYRAKLPSDAFPGGIDFYITAGGEAYGSKSAPQHVN